LVPIVEHAWESKGLKHIHVLGIKDKRQVSVLVSSFAIGVLHIIFTSTTPKTLGHWNNERKTICVTNKRYVPNSENHWSNLETTKHFMENIMVRYHQAQLELLVFQTC
jgi:hypothetical protein